MTKQFPPPTTPEEHQQLLKLKAEVEAIQKELAEQRRQLRLANQGWFDRFMFGPDDGD